MYVIFCTGIYGAVAVAVAQELATRVLKVLICVQVITYKN
jgi:hypothetical protein